MIPFYLSITTISLLILANLLCLISYFLLNTTLLKIGIYIYIISTISLFAWAIACLIEKL